MVIGIDGRALQFRSWGGVRHYTLELLQELFRLDHENKYHVFYNAWKKIEVPHFLEFPNVTVHYSRWPNKFFNLSVKFFSKPTFHAENGALDILFVPNLNFVACTPTTKLITVVHDLSFEHFPEYFPWRFRFWHRALNPRALFQRAAHVIAVSEHTKQDLVETYGIAPEKVSVVYPGVNQRLASSVQRLKSDSLDPRPYTLVPAPYILYFGALEPRKNIDGLIAAYELLHTPSPLVGEGRGEGLVIAGLSTPYVKHIKKRIAQSPMRDHIVLKENPTEEEKHTLYAGATLFVYPSFYEGFGFPPLEAMAHGVPVVASAVSSIPEVCGDAAILVNPWKIEEIKEGMQLLLADDKLCTHYIQAGYARVKQFSWERCARHVLQTFQNKFAYL